MNMLIDIFVQTVVADGVECKAEPVLELPLAQQYLSLIHI